MPLFRIAQAIARFIGYLIFNIVQTGRENIPKKGAVIIASNHINLVDPGLHAICIRRTFRTMAKVELFRHKLLGFILRPLGAFPVTRGKADKRSFVTAANVLRDEHALLIFPEGTRSRTGQLGTFKAGTVALCAMTKAPIIPAAMIQRKHLRLFDKVVIVYGEPITYEELGLDDTSSANLRRGTEILQKRVADMIEAKGGQPCGKVK